MPKLKEFSKGRKLELLTQALAVEDLREVLTGGLHRRHILGISNWGLNEGILTEDQFNAILGKIERPREFPREPEQRLEALLSVGNTEPKQVVSLLLTDNSQSIEALRSQFVSLIQGVQYKDKQWEPKVPTIESYLIHSLDPIGFIAFPVIGRGKIEYARTQAGRFYGQPVMAFMLNIANQLGMSMYRVLGPTCTHGDSRAPYNRFRILEFLLSQHKNGKVAREIDISDLLNLDCASIIGHLNALKEVGLIEWDSVSSESKGQIVYRWKEGKNPNEVPKYSGLKNLTKEVAEYLCRYRECNNVAIAEHLKAKEGYKKREYHSNRINNILSHLKKHDFAESDYKGGTVFSHINLNREMVGFVEEFTLKLRGAVEGGAELKAMEHIYGFYIGEYGRFKHDSRTSVGFYVDISPNLNKLAAEEAERRIWNYLLERGNSRPIDMKNGLGFDVDNHFGNMITAGMVVKRKEGRKTIYSLNPNYRPS